MSCDPWTYRELAELAELAWAWVLTQVRQGESGVWLTEHPGQTEPGEFPYGIHAGVGGLAHVMEEIGLARPLVVAELALGEEIRETLVRRLPEETAYDYFDGLTSTIGVLTALQAGGAELAVARLLELATPSGWPTSWIGPPRAIAGGRCNDATLGTASVLLGAVWAHRHDVLDAAELAAHAVDILLAERGATRRGGLLAVHPVTFPHGRGRADAELVARSGRDRCRAGRSRDGSRPVRPDRGGHLGHRPPADLGRSQ